MAFTKRTPAQTHTHKTYTQAHTYLVIQSGDVRDVHVVCGWTDILILLSIEDIYTNHVDLHNRYKINNCAIF